MNPSYFLAPLTVLVKIPLYNKWNRIKKIFINFYYEFIIDNNLFLCFVHIKIIIIIINSRLSRISESNKEAEINKEAVVARLTQLVILDSLCAYISYQRRDITIELMENVVDIIGDHRK